MSDEIIEEILDFDEPVDLAAPAAVVSPGGSSVRTTPYPVETKPCASMFFDKELLAIKSELARTQRELQASSRDTNEKFVKLLEILQPPAKKPKVGDTDFVVGSGRLRRSWCSKDVSSASDGDDDDDKVVVDPLIRWKASHSAADGDKASPGAADGVMRQAAELPLVIRQAVELPTMQATELQFL